MFKIEAVFLRQPFLFRNWNDKIGKFYFYQHSFVQELNSNAVKYLCNFKPWLFLHAGFTDSKP